VDLEGGTILVYEIDTSKQQKDEKTGKGEYDAQQVTNLLATKLKQRIDPNDLYNIVIRPAGGEGRVEIILPTRGSYRTRQAEEAWDRLLKQLQQEWPEVGKLDVGRGKMQELVDRIQIRRAEKVWREQLFASDTAWKSLLNKAQDRWLDLKADPTFKAQLEKIKPGRVRELIELVEKLPGSPPEREVESWVKKQAWEELLDRAQQRWPALRQSREELEKISPDRVEELVGRIQTLGNVYAQAGLTVLEPVLGQVPLADDPQAKEKHFVDPKEVEDFVSKNYGPSARAIERTIEERYTAGERGKDLTVEEVQRIKELSAP